MRARMYQRPHRRSPNAIAKQYRFLRLPMAVDVEPIAAELARIPIPWLQSQWKWHRGTQFCVLRGGPAGALPGDELTNGAGVDAAVLAMLPRVRGLLDTLFPCRATLAWIGRSPPGSAIRLHIDNTPQWDEHHRVHVPIVTSPGARICVGGRFVHMPPGSVWAFNNSVPHGAINAGPERLHLIFDLPSTAAIEDVLAASEPCQGELDEGALERLAEDPLAGLTDEERAHPEILARMMQQ
jgi:hypothetical protein